MKRYPAYKDSGIEWVGQIPEHWHAVRLKFLLERNDGGVWGEDLDGIEKNATKVFRSTEINIDGSWDLTEEPEMRILSTKEKLKALLKEGDLLVTKSSGSQLHIGKTALVNKGIENLECCYSNFMQRLRPLNKEIAKYLYIFLNSQLSRIQYNYLSNSSTGLANLSSDLIGEIIIPTPPPKEQQSIAIYLDRKTAQIDDLIAKKERMIELFKDERTAVINQAVTKGLDSKAEMKDSGIEWLGMVPRHWEIKRIKYLLKNNKRALKTGPFGSQLKHSDMQGDSIKVYNQRSVLDNDFDFGDLFISDEKFVELREFEIFPDDILLTTRGTIGKCTIFPQDKPRGILHPCLIRIQLDSQKILNQYAQYYMQDSSFFLESVKYNSNATTIDVIYGDTLRDVTFVVPPIKEQGQIVKHIEYEINKLDSMISRVTNQIELLQEYRTALISEVVTGKIDVRG